jgi:arabinogalactan endo-1,4-beta-galactosidase
MLKRANDTATAAAVLVLAFAASAAGQTPARPKLGKFTLGADVSAIAAPPRGGASGGGARAVAGSGGSAAARTGGGRGPLTYNENGQPAEEWEILMRHGWNLFRLRVFVSPVRSAPNNSLENTIPLAKKIKSAGATFLLDLHFSDTWADPGHQEIPVAWRELDIGGLEKAWEKHAYHTIKALKDAGAMPDMVQIGNEITRGAAWPVAQLQIPGNNQNLLPGPYDEARQWSNLTRLLKAGIRGVEAASGKPRPRIVIHIDQGGHWETTRWFFDHIAAAKVKYDVIGQSFYPAWGHGSLDQLWYNMNQCAKRYKKDFAVVETGYMAPRTAGAKDLMLWPVTPEGRLQFLVDLMNTVRQAPRGIGIMYWAPERDAWNADGSPGPSVFLLDNLTTLAKSPDSHAPAALKR